MSDAEKIAKLQAFKDYVHKRLDEAGVTVDPESSHKAEGCRIGGRLDEVFAVRANLLAACRQARVCGKHPESCGWWDVRGRRGLIHSEGACNCWLSQLDAAIAKATT